MRPGHRRLRTLSLGAWTADLDRLVLVHRECLGYEIDLEGMTTSAETLDWIFQLRGKVWITREDVGDLIEILDRLLAPQANLCSFGCEGGPIDVRAVIAAEVEA